MGDRKLGVGFTPFGGPHPNLTLASDSTGDPEKNGFCLGGIGPHLGEIWRVEIWHFGGTLAFCSELCRQIFDFLTAFDIYIGVLTTPRIACNSDD